MPTSSESEASMKQKRVYVQAQDGTVMALSVQQYRKRNFRKISYKVYRELRQQQNWRGFTQAKAA